MRFLIPLSICLNCYGQLPVTPWVIPKTATVTNLPPLANLVAWYKRDAGKFQDFAETVPSGTNTPVQIWRDQTTNHFDVTNYAASATWPTNVLASPGGTNMSVFFTDANFQTSTGCVLTNGVATLPGGAYSLFTLFRQTGDHSHSSGAGIFCADYYNTNDTPAIIPNFISAGKYSYRAGTPNGIAAYDSFTLLANVWYVLTLVADTSNMTVRTNGVPLLPPPTSGGSYLATHGMLIGSGWNSSVDANSVVGDIVEILLYSGNLTGTAQLTNVETYLQGL